MPDETTARGYPLPHPDNIAVSDVERVREAISRMDTDIMALEARIKQMKVEGLLGLFLM